MLENVDRLLKSPASQRGRDFAVMLSSLNALGYAVEWRVINAAEYGMPQRRRRIFIMGYHKSSTTYQRLISKPKTNWLTETGVIAKAFPIKPEFTNLTNGILDSDIQTVSDEFNQSGGNSPFENTGLMVDGKYVTLKSETEYHSDCLVLEDLLVDDSEVPEEFFISKEELSKHKGWRYLKGPKKIERINKQGHKYVFSEGGLIFPDPLDKPSRTIITGEGGAAPSRFKHVVERKGRHRRLVPIELERLNMFPDDHTKLDGITDQKRAFFMGNALVVGIVEKLGSSLSEHIQKRVPRDLEAQA